MQKSAPTRLKNNRERQFSDVAATFISAAPLVFHFNDIISTKLTPNKRGGGGGGPEKEAERRIWSHFSRRSRCEGLEKLHERNKNTLYKKKCCVAA